MRSRANRRPSPSMPPEDKPNTCSNAGVFIRKGIEGVSLDQWSKLGAVNMTGFLGRLILGPVIN